MFSQIGMWLIRRFPLEIAHKISILIIKYNILILVELIDALITLSWTIPVLWLIKQLEKIKDC